LTAGLTGCGGSGNSGFVELAQEADARQAQQNNRIAEQSKDLAETVRHVAVADAEARKELTAVQREVALRLHDDAVALREQRSAFENRIEEFENRNDRRVTWGGVLTYAGELLICVLPIVLAIYVLRLVNRPIENAEMTDALLTELTTTESSPLLPPPSGGPSRESIGLKE
jgi:hypothetical protein